MIHVVPIDLKRTEMAPLTPVIAQRIHEFAQKHEETMDPWGLTASVMARLWQLDRSLCVVALVNDEVQSIVGHVVAWMENHGKPVVFILQAKADGNVGDAMQRAAQFIEDWGRAQGAVRCIAVTQREPELWKKYGYKLSRHLITKDLVGEGVK